MPRIHAWAHNCLTPQLYLRITLFILRIQGMWTGSSWFICIWACLSFPGKKVWGRWRGASVQGCSSKALRTWGLCWSTVWHWSCLSIFEHKYVVAPKGVPILSRREFLWIPLKRQGGVLSELICFLPGFIWFLIFSQFKPECQSFLSSISPADSSIGDSVLNHETAPACLSHLPIYLINTIWNPETQLS